MIEATEPSHIFRSDLLQKEIIQLLTEIRNELRQERERRRNE